MPRDDISPSQSAPFAAHDLPQHAVRVKGLEKTYGGRGRTPAKHALKAVDLAIPRGSLFGLLGPNGAGKSTMINIFAGLVHKTGGTVELWDTDIDRSPRQARASIGVVPQELNIDPFFTPRALLEMQAGLYGVPPRERRTDELLATMSLTDKADAYARSLSGGMRRRLMVAKAMVHDPPILVLDEPTAGVDVELRRQLWEHVQALNARGTTILLTTHYLHEAEALCDEIAIINHGDIVACDTTPNMLRRLDSKTIILNVQEALTAVPATLTPYDAELLDAHRIAIQYHRSTSPVAGILEAVGAAGLSIADVSTREAALEDIFLQITAEPDAATAAA
ncbi:ABC-2 type transport system ATP-binding protein [Limimonas halophila]|uniref:ABC-2 type transport system ATP-binding protein n=1 Tax=Limimonas halophila TaxID=1082479 RepID=A0A1G7S783_9PROT|nr:ABC transporter ATP-binding protein [Limimonas halophila]SDG18843.1 ABC-2 type transport system ATP-binding protein [Limimonas halophila]